jgi:hypothetical protein
MRFLHHFCWAAFGFTAMRLWLALFRCDQFKIYERLANPHQYSFVSVSLIDSGDI